MSDPVSNSELREVFNQQLEAVRLFAERMEAAMTNQKPPMFFVPELRGWSGDLSDIEGMSQAFDRSEIHDDFRDTIQKDDNGVVSDLELEITQGDFVARMERAYRQLHHSAVRDRLHAGGRLRGHSHEQGVLNKGIRGYLEHLKNMGSS